MLKKYKSSYRDKQLVAFTMPVDGVKVTNIDNVSTINFKRERVKIYQQNNDTNKKPHFNIVTTPI
jgi:hypothetical protein